MSMNNLLAKQEEFLRELFFDRVNFDLQERQLYSSDVGTMPKMMRKFTGDNLPAAIVQPVNEEELSALCRWAQENKIALIPRGKATSGYGGVVPVQGGIIVEFNRMKQIYPST